MIADRACNIGVLQKLRLPEDGKLPQSVRLHCTDEFLKRARKKEFNGGLFKYKDILYNRIVYTKSCKDGAQATTLPGGNNIPDIVILCPGWLRAFKQSKRPNGDLDETLRVGTTLDSLASGGAAFILAKQLLQTGTFGGRKQLLHVRITY